MTNLRNPKYILPNGREWKGSVHQMEDDSWMTGATHTKHSIALVQVDEIWNYPRTGAVATQKIFEQIFSYTATASKSTEDLLKIFNGKITSLETLIDVTKDILEINVNKIKQYLDSKVIQDENHGRGSIIDSNLNLTLDEVASQNFTERISEIKYLPNNENNYFLWPGNIESGTYYGTEAKPSCLLKAVNMRLFADMVSRTGASAGNIDPAKITLDDSYAFGFKGKIQTNLETPAKITTISILSNYEIETITLNEGTDDEKVLTEWNSFSPINVNSITFDIDYVAPVPFSSYMAADFSEDFMGDGVITDGYLFPEDIYQRTRLELGPVRVYAKQYSESKEIILGPYYCSAGTLASINFTANESLYDAEIAQKDIEYALILNNKEYPITPTNRSFSSIHTYKINSLVAEGARSSSLHEGTSFIDIDNPPVSWTLKVTINKPETSSISPIVHGVIFKYNTSLSGGVNV